MKQLIKTFSWYLYGGVSCYCLQRFLVDFLYISNDQNKLFLSGDIIILDIWNRLQLHKNNLICATSPDDHHQFIFGHVIGFENERINRESIDKNEKFYKIPKGNIAIKLCTNDVKEQIKILPMGLIEGRTLARIWPLSRYTSRLLNTSLSSLDN